MPQRGNLLIANKNNQKHCSGGATCLEKQEARWFCDLIIEQVLMPCNLGAFQIFA